MDRKTLATIQKLANLATSDSREEADSAAKGALRVIAKAGSTFEDYLKEADPNDIYQPGLVRVADAYVAGRDDLSPSGRRTLYAKLLKEISGMYSGRPDEDYDWLEGWRRAEAELRRRERAEKEREAREKRAEEESRRRAEEDLRHRERAARDKEAKEKKAEEEASRRRAEEELRRRERAEMEREAREKRMEEGKKMMLRSLPTYHDTAGDTLFEKFFSPS